MGNNTDDIMGQSADQVLDQIPEWAIKVRELREHLDQTQEQFGKRFGVTQAAVAYWESGRNEPPSAVLMFALTGKEPKAVS